MERPNLRSGQRVMLRFYLVETQRDRRRERKDVGAKIGTVVAADKHHFTVAYRRWRESFCWIDLHTGHVAVEVIREAA